MLKSAFLITPEGRISSNVTESAAKAIFEDVTSGNDAVDIEITFEHQITEFRNHDYSWVGLETDRIATEFSPKILKLANGCFVQANQANGIWEVHKKNPFVLLWRFNTKDSAPLTVYSGESSEKKISNADQNIIFVENPALLFSFANAVEFSRSPFDFSAIACFTDHCDYDTPQSLVMQREFFKSNSIKVTKGFFLNQYSKRENNASFHQDAAEFEKWLLDGHELAYHSLSQSIKQDKESFEDFAAFVPPFPDLTTWIDHGYQPYNLSLYQKNEMTDSQFADTLNENNISILWNYIDSGTATIGTINQLNPGHFTLKAFARGNRELSPSKRFKLLIKNIIFHYYADEKIINAYKNTAGKIKSIILKKRFSNASGMKIFALAVPILKVLFFWNSHKNKVYRLAHYSPLIFRHKIGNHIFHVFQTLEMVDFKKALHPSNIETLIKEKGVFIAHTYFSVPMGYHQGRIFRTDAEIDTEVAANFELLGEKIKNREIWNPTVKELVPFLANFENVILDADTQGNIKVVNASGLPYRMIT